MKFSTLPTLTFLAFTTAGVLAAPQPILVNRQNSPPPLSNPNQSSSLQPFSTSPTCSGPPTDVIIPVSYATSSIPSDTTLTQGCYEYIDPGTGQWTPVQSVRITGVWPEANACLLRFYEGRECARGGSKYGQVGNGVCGGFGGGKGVGSYQVVCQSG
ncbi:hypothetical protein B0T20DRAFT_478879 [Sordaria brevicollis]|uniref:Uncharacterized protein n=1 Tax=Sordaria brevicollis TaxID=83679 RepID=A0AAE0UCY2_SORBR|nr:hypothetical protein B0T20DRAFT_478879 [Sordaria brevicollis]